MLCGFRQCKEVERTPPEEVLFGRRSLCSSTCSVAVSELYFGSMPVVAFSSCSTYPDTRRVSSSIKAEKGSVATTAFGEAFHLAP
jgi:hypothetical protein